MVLMLFVLQCTDYKKKILTLTLTLTRGYLNKKYFVTINSCTIPLPHYFFIVTNYIITMVIAQQTRQQTQ